MLKQMCVLVACSGLIACNGDKAKDLNTLHKNQQKWEALNESEYEMEYSFSSFHPDSGVYRVYVENEQVSSMQYLGYIEQMKGKFIDKSHYLYQSATIAELFKRVEYVINHADKYEIEYNSQFGYPTLISVDYDQHAVDDEISYRVKSLNRGSDTGCTEQLVAGLIVDLSLADDANAELCDATVFIEEDGYVEQLDTCSENRFSGAWEREGTYAVTVNYPGYAPNTINDVTVYPFLCHVGQQYLAIELQPESP